MYTIKNTSNIADFFTKKRIGTKEINIQITERRIRFEVDEKSSCIFEMIGV
jgi:hypothetical protein